MAAAKKISLNSLFELIPPDETPGFNKYFFEARLTLIGRSTKNGELVIFRSMGGSSTLRSLSGSVKTTQWNADLSNVTFSFSWQDNKYLFQASVISQEHHQAELLIATDIFRIQRRSAKRIQIPLDYYAIIKFISLNGQNIRVFGKLANISAQGMGILLPNDSVHFVPGDQFKMILTMNQRPPENFVARVVHSRWIAGETREIEVNGLKEATPIKGLMVGCQIEPKDSMFWIKKINSITMDILRDLFDKNRTPEMVQKPRSNRR